MNNSAAPSDQVLYGLIIEAEDKFFAEGYDPIQRQFYVVGQVMNRLGYESFVMSGSGQPAILSKVEDFYGNFFRSKDRTRGPLHVGVYMFRDLVAKIEIPLLLGEVSINPFEMSDLTTFQMNWLCDDKQNQKNYLSSFYDIFDFGRSILPMAGVKLPPKEAQSMLGAARSHFISATSVLSGNLGLRGCSQSSLLAAELTIKALLKTVGANDKDLKNLGHNLTSCISAVKNGGVEMDFDKLLNVAARLPKYVADRYSEAGLSKVQCGKVLMDCQFIAGEAVRHLTAASVREIFEEQNEPLI